MKKWWYELNADGDIVQLGQFQNFEEAATSTAPGSLWLIDEDSAKDWLISLLIFNQQHKWGIDV